MKMGFNVFCDITTKTHSYLSSSSRHQCRTHLACFRFISALGAPLLSTCDDPILMLVYHV
jgi:hypothetical protein